MAMKIGLCFPYTQESLDRDLSLEWFKRVDEGPFSTLSCGERMIGTSVDMMALMGAAAAVTSRVRIVPTLYVLPMDPAVKVAKHAATLDLLAGGRVSITVGIGGRVWDYQCMEKEPVARYARMDEQVAQIRRVWAGEIPVEGGEPIGPALVKPGGPPILAGVMGPKATARAAKWADGVYSWSGNGNGEEMRVQQARVVEEWEKAGRDTAPERVAGFWCASGPNADENLKNYVYKYIKVLGEGPAKAMAGMVDRSTPDAIMQSLDAYEEAGVEECWLNTATADLSEIDGIEDIIAKRG
ncbi:MAG: LLM class flavin-dependent oxidoreductase [Deltaproteobacteria bacterium]|nr:LLM class flavin-dependent oxidoreductase [Deltaproteobacteria bacterium]